MGKKWVNVFYTQKINLIVTHILPMLPMLPICLLPIFYPFYPFCAFYPFVCCWGPGLYVSYKNVLKIRTGTVRSPPIKMGKFYPFFTHLLPISYTVQVLTSVLRQLYLFLYSLELSYKKVTSKL